MVDLRKDGEHVRQMWRTSDDAHVPLRLAAALAFHEAHGAAEALMSGEDYHNALDLTAAALSRLLMIYTISERTGLPLPARLGMTGGRFRDGATLYQHTDGGAVTSLSVLREDLPAAIRVIKTAGMPFHFE